ncbi:hypothetical protein MFIFM68171_06767 [Madurella fahalii]|uniref:Uncharacterized protein n=1 Tax=Madurella fahalii TaxID=1157608 RepID=A0ABQ0GFQ1_9PEZI
MSVRSTARFRLASGGQYLGLRKRVTSLAMLKASDPDGKYPKIQEMIRNYKEPEWLLYNREAIDDLRKKELDDYIYRRRLEHAKPKQNLVSDQFQYLFMEGTGPLWAYSGHVSLVDKTDLVDWEVTIQSTPAAAWKLRYDTPYELRNMGADDASLLATPSITGFYHKVLLGCGERGYVNSYKDWNVEGITPPPRFSSRFRFQKLSDHGSNFLKDGDSVYMEITTPDEEKSEKERLRSQVSKILEHSVGGEEWTQDLKLKRLTFTYEALPGK